MSSDALLPAEIPPVTPGQVADLVAATYALRDYHQRLAANTRRRQHDDLTLFSRYLHLASMVVSADELMGDITTWAGVTHGLVAGFVRYQEREGYAIGSINVRLATVKRYCAVAAEAHILDAQTYGLIALVKGYSHKQGHNLDRDRAQTRKSTKKAAPVALSREQATQLKAQPDTPQGRRDTLLMCLLLDHGLRCGEIAALTLACLDLHEETLTFYREKVDMVQKHALTKDTRLALRRYLETTQLVPEDFLLQGSRRSGKLEGRMSERAITARMNTLGTRLGITGLSAHDGRHAWATAAVRAGTDLKSLQTAGGWRSEVMPLRYAAEQQIANAGVKLE